MNTRQRTLCVLLALVSISAAAAMSDFADLIQAVEHKHRTSEQRAHALYLYFICSWSLKAIATAFRVKSQFTITKWVRRYNEGLAYSRKTRNKVFMKFSPSQI
jgi:hypothetical protein